MYCLGEEWIVCFSCWSLCLSSNSSYLCRTFICILGFFIFVHYASWISFYLLLCVVFRFFCVFLKLKITKKQKKQNKNLKTLAKSLLSTYCSCLAWYLYTNDIVHCQTIACYACIVCLVWVILKFLWLCVIKIFITLIVTWIDWLCHIIYFYLTSIYCDVIIVLQKVESYLYLYIPKSWIVVFIFAEFLLSHIIHLFTTFSSSFLIIFLSKNFSPYNYISSNISPLNLFIFPLLYTLTL